MKEYELVVTYKCNWNCTFCAVDTHNQPKLPIEDIEEKIKKIEFGSEVTLSGGEVGTMSMNDIVYIITLLELKQCKLSLNTNGLFIKKYPELLNKFKEILYHCSEDLTEIEVMPDEFNSSFTKYMIVVDDMNFKNLDSFLNKYSHIKFDIVPSTMPEGVDLCTLSYKNKVKIFTKYQKHMTEESKYYLMKGRPYDIRYL